MVKALKERELQRAGGPPQAAQLRLGTGRFVGPAARRAVSCPHQATQAAAPPLSGAPEGKLPTGEGQGLQGMVPLRRTRPSSQQV